MNEIIEGNRRIAAFTDYPLLSVPESVSPLKFHTSWDWFIPAYSKFYKLKIKDLIDSMNHESYCNQIDMAIYENDIAKAHDLLAYALKKLL